MNTSMHRILVNIFALAAIGTVPIAAWGQSTSRVSRDPGASQPATVAVSGEPGVRVASAGQAPPGFRHGAMSQAASRRFPGGFSPPHERFSAHQLLTQGEYMEGEVEIMEGETFYQSSPGDIQYELGGDGGCTSCGGGGSCGGCTSCEMQGECLRCPTFSLRRYRFFGGAQGFTGRPNQGSAGSFGFHYGLNRTNELPCLAGLTTQAGLQFVHSNFDGAALTPDKRNQVFFTGGLFRRVDWGLQFGGVVDFLHDEWYTSMDLAQIRGEVSWVWPQTHELGFRITQSITTDSNPARFNSPTTGAQVNRIETWEAEDLYAAFYRHRFLELPGGEMQIYGGVSSGSDGLFGGDINLPVNDYWAAQFDWVYLIPEGGGNGGRRLPGEAEAWNLSFNIVLYPGGNARWLEGNYTRPLFNVANNGTFIIDRRP